MNTIDFGGRLAIHPGEALYLVGYSRTLQGAKKTAPNLIYRNAYPLPLTIVAGTGHFLMGNVQLGLLGNLLLGSIPGVLLGAYLSHRTPDSWLRKGIAVVLSAVGVKLLLT